VAVNSRVSCSVAMFLFAISNWRWKPRNLRSNNLSGCHATTNFLEGTSGAFREIHILSDALTKT